MLRRRKHDPHYNRHICYSSSRLLYLEAILRRYLRESTRRLRENTEKKEKEIRKSKELKKHLGYPPIEKEVFEPTWDEEENESRGIPSSAVMDSEDEEEDN